VTYRLVFVKARLLKKLGRLQVGSGWLYVGSRLSSHFLFNPQTMPALTTVLIVEDDASLRETVQLYIEREDCAVEARIMAWMASLKFNATARFSRVGYHAA